MPQWDRYWPMGRLAALVMLATSGGLDVWYLASLIGLPQRLGLPPLTDLGDMGGDVIWIGGPGGLALLGWSRDARRRTLARRRARNGEEGAIRLASIVPDPADAPPESALPLELVWRRKPRGREWVPLFIVTLFFGSVPVLLVATGLIFGASPQNLGNFLFQGPNGDVIMIAILASFFVSGMVASFIALILALASRLGPPYGVMADEHGIRQLHLKGPGSLLRWSDIHWIEVFQFSTDAQRVFSAFGTKASIYWEDFTRVRRRGRRVRIDFKELELRQRAVLALVAARTGRQPRSFSLALMRDEDIPEVPRRKCRLLAYSFGYSVAAVLLALPVAVLSLPLTHFALLNYYAAVTCAAAGMGIGVIVRRALNPRTRPIGDEVQFTLPVESPLNSDPVTVSYRRALASRLHDAAIGVPLVLDLVPAFAGIASATHSYISPLAAFATRVVASLVFFVAMVGVAAIIIALQSGRATLTLDTNGLSERAGRKMLRFSWHEIVAVNVALERGQPESYFALSRSGETINLPARNAVWRAPELGQQTLSPNELAALVVARSGATLLVKDV